MGHFDGYQFDQRPYADNGGGMIARLPAQLQTQGQSQQATAVIAPAGFHVMVQTAHKECVVLEAVRR
ncbi:hypothetical protein [Bradyrhizobium sp. 191]|uniref:hypothetical protein n=1 Tax=Bradyrhizobium sp. 191 TaxID=2782659 RepID=UPI001FFE7F3C|nr:hypothetical protein [Bradyrhizobium sp. 191]UPJ63517.1 hypothetical protein IVB23_26295 [Bradyrhizobium sp. 191]